MLWALCNDLAQRLISVNKTEQKAHLRKRLSALPPRDKRNVLDFGCGTGLFRSVFSPLHFTYVGYDVDRRLTDYARLLHGKEAFFTASFDEVASRGPYDLILANCCFHHIEDRQLDFELGRLREILHPHGVFFLIDLCLIAHPANWLHKMVLGLERGEHLRTAEAYVERVGKHFDIVETDKTRIHPFCLRNNAAYYEVIFCAGAPGKTASAHAPP